MLESVQDQRVGVVNRRIVLMAPVVSAGILGTFQMGNVRERNFYENIYLGNLPLTHDFMQ